MKRLAPTVATCARYIEKSTPARMVGLARAASEISGARTPAGAPGGP